MIATETKHTGVIKDTVLHEIMVRDRSTWCRLLWEDSGQVIILSDYGHWAYWWGHRGSQSVPEFLVDLDISYAGSKMMGADLFEYSAKSTVQAIQEYLSECEADQSLDADVLTEERDLANQLAGNIDFREWYERSELQDACEFRRTEICGTWKAFWDFIWVPMIQPQLRNILS